MAKYIDGKCKVASVVDLKVYECVGDGEVHHSALLEPPPWLGIEPGPFVDLYEPVNGPNDSTALTFVEFGQGSIDLGEEICWDR